MSDLVERLRDPLSSDNWLTDRRDAADEIERLQSLLEAANEMEADREAALQEIERLQTERDNWRERWCEANDEIDRNEKEIERLTACVEHHQAVEADQERAIERLQSELERLQKLVDRYEPVYGALTHASGVEFTLCEQQEKIERLRSALERAYKAGHNDDCLFCGFKDKILIEELHTQSGDDDE